MKKICKNIMIFTFCSFMMVGCSLFPNKQDTLLEKLNIEEKIENFESSSLNTFVIEVGETHTPGAAIWKTNDKQNNVLCHSTDTSIATIDGTGTVTGVKKGSAFIVIAASTNVYSIYKYVVGAEQEIDNSSNLPTIEGIDVEQEIKNFKSDSLNTFVLSVNGTHKPSAAIWTNNDKAKCYTTNSDVVTINSRGNVTAVSKGTAYVFIVASTGMYQVYKYIVD